MTVRVKVCAALVSTPPSAVPPLSCARTVTVAVPLAVLSGVKVSVPLAPIAGATLKSAELSVVTMKLTVCAASPDGPAEMAVTKLLEVTSPLLAGTVMANWPAVPAEV